MVNRLACNSVSNCCHGLTKRSQHKKATNAVLTFKREWDLPSTMGKAVGLMTTGLGAYLTFKMWAEFQENLGSVFGTAWGGIIAFMVFIIYQSNKNEKDYETSFGNILTDTVSKSTMEAENNPQPVAFIAGFYVFIIVIFEILLGTL